MACGLLFFRDMTTTVPTLALMFLSLLSLGGAGCHDWNSVELEATYGFCAGYCRRTVTLDPGASGTIVHDTPWDGDVPRVETPVAYPARAGELDDAVDRASSISWQERYGCPDCVDQGSFRLTLHSGGATRTTLLDPQQHPAELDPLLAIFADIRADHPPPPIQRN